LVAHTDEERRLKIFENRVLGRLFGSKMYETTRLNNEEFYALYFSPNIIRVIRSRRQMGRARIPYGGEERCTGFWWGNLKKVAHLEDPEVDERTLLKWIFEKRDGSA
jgi:hypothetical protein